MLRTENKLRREGERPRHPHSESKLLYLYTLTQQALSPRARDTATHIQAGLASNAVCAAGALCQAALRSLLLLTLHIRYSLSLSPLSSVASSPLHTAHRNKKPPRLPTYISNVTRPRPCRKMGVRTLSIFHSCSRHYRYIFYRVDYTGAITL